LQGKVCLVTGANRGIGKATVEGLARRGATVIMVCRDAESGEQTRAEVAAATGNPRIELLVANLAVQAEVRGLADMVKAKYPRLDVLINNAGAFFLYRTRTLDDLEATFAINHLAPFILTNALTEVLKASAPSRVINVASEAHQRVTDPEDWESAKGYNGRVAYARSKLANVMFSYDLAHRLEGSGVTVNCCDPGLVRTKLLESKFDRWWSRWAWPLVSRFTVSPQEGAKTILHLATSPDVEGVTGKYFVRSRPATSSLISHDPVLGARLWNISLRYTGELPPIAITGEHIAH
jgi:NAD(P)-dependent dehydrogenase (short-subunit alcohol dehydrogenase family)